MKMLRISLMPMIAKAAAMQKKKKGPKESMEPKAEEKKEAKMPPMARRMAEKKEMK